MLERLMALCALPGVSGWEGPVRAYLKQELSPLGLELFTDPLGNLYAHRPGKGPRIMVAAHMDEVGMVVSGIREDGTLFYRAAGLDSRVLPGKRVRVGPKGIPGVIGSKAIHLQKKEEFERAYSHEELYVDIGAKDKESAQEAVGIGDPIAFDSQPQRMGELLCAKALDDRVGCAILSSILADAYECDLWGVFTVQEEVGTRGAMAAAARVAPELALVLEGTTANDMPGLRPDEMVTQVGQGAAITLMDGRTMAPPRLYQALFQTAAAHGIPCQPRRGARGGTDAGAIHQALGGCPAGGVSVPCRYIHSPNSLCSIKDVEAAYSLVWHFLKDAMWKEVIPHAGN